MPRRTPIKEIIAEETTVSSPLRRSSRLSNNSPVPTRVLTRRTSATEAATTTPKATRSRRLSYNEDSAAKDETTSAKKGGRRTPTTEEKKPITRSRRSSVTKTEELPKVAEEVVGTPQNHADSPVKKKTPEPRVKPLETIVEAAKDEVVETSKVNLKRTKAEAGKFEPNVSIISEISVTECDEDNKLESDESFHLNLSTTKEGNVEGNLSGSSNKENVSPKEDVIAFRERLTTSMVNNLTSEPMDVDDEDVVIESQSTSNPSIEEKKSLRINLTQLTQDELAQAEKDKAVSVNEESLVKEAPNPLNKSDFESSEKWKTVPKKRLSLKRSTDELVVRKSPRKTKSSSTSDEQVLTVESQNETSSTDTPTNAESVVNIQTTDVANATPEKLPEKAAVENKNVAEAEEIDDSFFDEFEEDTSSLDNKATKLEDSETTLPIIRLLPKTPSSEDDQSCDTTEDVPNSSRKENIPDAAEVEDSSSSMDRKISENSEALEVLMINDEEVIEITSVPEAISEVVVSNTVEDTEVDRIPEPEVTPSTTTTSEDPTSPKELSTLVESSAPSKSISIEHHKESKVEESVENQRKSSPKKINSPIVVRRSPRLSSSPRKLGIESPKRTLEKQEERLSGSPRNCDAQSPKKTMDKPEENNESEKLQEVIKSPVKNAQTVPEESYSSEEESESKEAKTATEDVDQSSENAEECEAEEPPPFEKKKKRVSLKSPVKKARTAPAKSFSSEEDAESAEPQTITEDVDQSSENAEECEAEEPPPFVKKKKRVSLKSPIKKARTAPAESFSSEEDSESAEPQTVTEDVDQSSENAEECEAEEPPPFERKKKRGSLKSPIKKARTAPAKSFSSEEDSESAEAQIITEDVGQSADEIKENVAEERQLSEGKKKRVSLKSSKNKSDNVSPVENSTNASSTKLPQSKIFPEKPPNPSGKAMVIPISKKVDDQINELIAQVNDSSSSSECNVKNYIDDMADEVADDEYEVQSEEENSLLGHTSIDLCCSDSASSSSICDYLSTEDTPMSTDDSDDSFIDDGDIEELLPGEEYDLEMEKPKKSRIIQMSSDSGEEIVTVKATKKKNEKTPATPKRSRIIEVSDSSEEDIGEVIEKQPKVEEESEIQESVVENKSPAKSPASQKIVILENVRVPDIQDKSLRGRINQVVSELCSGFKNKGDVSLNLSVDYIHSSPAAVKAQEDSVVKSQDETGLESTGVPEVSSNTDEFEDDAFLELSEAMLGNTKRRISQVVEGTPNEKSLSTKRRKLALNAIELMLMQGSEKLETPSKSSSKKKSKKSFVVPNQVTPPTESSMESEPSKKKKRRRRQKKKKVSTTVTTSEEKQKSVRFDEKVQIVEKKPNEVDFNLASTAPVQESKKKKKIHKTFVEEEKPVVEVKTKKNKKRQRENPEVEVIEILNEPPPIKIKKKNRKDKRQVDEDSSPKKQDVGVWEVGKAKLKPSLQNEESSFDNVHLKKHQNKKRAK